MKNAPESENILISIKMTIIITVIVDSLVGWEKAPKRGKLPL